MSCSARFVAQCNWWSNYTIISVSVILVTVALLEYKHFNGWDVMTKTIATWGVATCIVWWMWIMKKLYDIAQWWMQLHHHVTHATQLLQETKADINDIKKLSAPAS